MSMMEGKKSLVRKFMSLYIINGKKTKLLEKTDYMLSYKDNINACEDLSDEANAPKVVITTTMYGVYTKTFMIQKASAPNPQEMIQKIYDYNGAVQERTVDLSGTFGIVYGDKTGYQIGTPIEDSTISGSVLSGMPFVSSSGILTYSTNAGTEGDFVTIPVTVFFANYKDATLNVKVVFDMQKPEIKKTVKISGIEIKDSVYSKNSASYTGTAKVISEDNTDLTDVVNLTYTYSGTQADGSIYAATSNAPVNAGNYRLTVAVAQDNETYTGSADISFKIAKAPLTITARDMGVKIGAPLPQAEEYLYDTTADGYTFTGWYKDKDCTVLWDFAKDTVQADTTLYAGWKTNDASGGDDSEDAFPVEWEYPETLQVTSTALAEYNIEVKAKKRIYDGTPYTPDVKVTIKDAKGKKTVLTEGADYSVKYSSNVNAGEKGTVKVRGNGAYTGIVTKTFTISPKPVKKLKTVTGGMIANADTNLESPEFLASLPVYVYDGTKKLTYNEDYTLTIIKGDIAKKGKLQVAVSAKDGLNYTGTGKDAAKATVTVYETTGKNFKGIINSADVAFERESDKSQTYTGKALKPAFKVTVNGTVLGKKDFSVKYTNNKEAGTAYATITGKGGYVGSVVRTFSIEPVAENGGFALKKAIKAPTYNGKVQKPKVTITSGGKTLKAGKDYRISYSNNLHATPENAADQDKAKITVTGIGNYKGMKGKFFFIHFYTYP